VEDAKNSLELITSASQTPDKKKTRCLEVSSRVGYSILLF